MKYRLMDILACPICKNFPLQLYVFHENKYEYNVDLGRKVLCEEYCGLNAKFLRDLDSGSIDCKACLMREVDEGVLFCSKCGRWYPIIEEIPHMLPDDLRDKNSDLSFLKKYANVLPANIVLKGLPWNLSTN
ncbi:MAG: Trm112 family protein [archaeon YNP-LCB-024-027]|nr:Trm112 family protein [Candidatus Culexarchaeum yellowstonense]